MEPRPGSGGRQPLRDLGPPTASERTIIARILIRHGYPPPLPPTLRSAPPPRRAW